MTRALNSMICGLSLLSLLGPILGCNVMPLDPPLTQAQIDGATPNSSSPAPYVPEEGETLPFPTKYLNMNVPAQLSLQQPDRIEVGMCSGVFKIWSRDKEGFILNVTSDIAVHLDFKGPARFYNDENCKNEIHQLVISQGQARATFWFKATSVLTEGLMTISSPQLTGDTQAITVTPNAVDLLQSASDSQSD